MPSSAPAIRLKSCHVHLLESVDEQHRRAPTRREMAETALAQRLEAAPKVLAAEDSPINR
jgi:hypothetical protein